MPVFVGQRNWQENYFTFLPEIGAWYQRSHSRAAWAGEEKSTGQLHLQGAAFPCLQGNKLLLLITVNVQRFFLEGGIARPVGLSCFHFSCSKRKPLWSSCKGSQKSHFPHWRDVWDSDGAFSALQPIPVSSGWLLSCPHDLLAFPWPLNAATLQFSPLAFHVSVSLA